MDFASTDEQNFMGLQTESIFSLMVIKLLLSSHVQTKCN